uniref:DUF38 domain-containing protein n=1 Tax=Panagrolaimus sp. ES5 TaxID=591445 RepID=A0AC34FSN6_9BILA
MAKNPKNASVYQKLIQTCKYFFALNPIIVAPVLVCVKKEWFACERFECFGELYKYCKINDIPTKFKIWLSRSIDTNFEDVSRLSPLIPRIYRSDAIEITLLYCESSPIGFFYDAPVQKVKKFITFHDFLFFAANAERIVLDNRSIKYENGDTVLFETIIKSLPKLKWLYYESDDGKDITSNSAFNLMEDFKGFSYLNLNGFTEKLDVETIFDFIIKNKHIEFNLHYHPDLSFPFKELVRKYSKLLLNESQCQSTIKFPRMDYDNISDLEGLDIDDEE